MAKVDMDEYRRQVDAMDKAALQQERARLEEDLEDLDTERRLIIGQTGVHVNAVKIQSYREAFDRDERLLRGQLEVVDIALNEGEK
ncbi:MAG: hypothetical protein ACYC1U_10965 [Candidatus Aquicultorales bacterium]